jgi:signal transduction histidine kinase
MQERIGAIGAATVRMRGLLTDLLTFADATQEPLRMEDVDVTGLVETQWAHVRQQDPDRGVDWRVEPGLTAHADPRLLGIVFDNLLDNAFKFTRDTKAARIEVGSVHLEIGGTAFYVRDNGAGFEPRIASSLFEPFRRFHSAKEFEGTGIGLATVRRIVERHGGSVWGESHGPGQGATIYLRLLPSGLP